MIQLPDRPSSAVIGDLESFKLEYLDSGITIKPLKYGARTNLYIYTDSQRFNVHLVSVPKEQADYIVYLKSAGSLRRKPSSISWHAFERSQTKDGVQLKIKRLGRTEGFFLVEFAISALKEVEIRPEWFWVTQNGKYRPIHSLYLSAVRACPRLPVTGTITLRQSDLLLGVPPKLELSSKNKFVVALPEVVAWPQ